MATNTDTASAISGSGWAQMSSATIWLVPAMTVKLISVVSKALSPFWAAATPKPIPKGSEASPGKTIRSAPAWKLRQVTRADRDIARGTLGWAHRRWKRDYLVGLIRRLARD